VERASRDCRETILRSLVRLKEPRRKSRIRLKYSV
jgi:hypothetical protein